MERFVKGDVVILPFPFSNLSNAKKRPALVLANLSGYDLIVCQITSRYKQDRHALSLMTVDFQNGKLPVDSFIRQNRLFTADSRIILYRVGNVKSSFIDSVVNSVCNILRKP